METTLEQLLEAWWTNHRINLYLIRHISPEGMESTLSTRGGRSVGRQFAHLHNQRVYHLEGRAADLAAGLTKFPSKKEPSKVELVRQLEASAAGVATHLERCLTGEGKRRPLKKGVIATLGYFIAHESHHRGSILLTLKQCGHKLDQATQSAIWNWDRM